MRLGDVAAVCRSKNAGPFLITLDILFEEPNTFQIARRELTPDVFAKLYRVSAAAVRVTAWDEFRVLKATLPRHIAGGSPGDSDVYGCQQHAPLLEFDIHSGTVEVK
jgi:hypothetical protein